MKNLNLNMAAADLVTRREAAQIMGIQPQTLAAWAHHDRYSLPFCKVGRAVRYRRTDIEKWIESRLRTKTD